ncbi:alpha/beta hydrolase [Veronia nyctiphanis]|uniref:Alpha/beta hydrolase n=1 Tax=Veronia nyctiphanis TaxID=1278244 RepID=A0A4Q0YNU9_9GAMM|nr:alpha/beta hydrolase [Veronia nyctiphanis]RXJ72125.1 alpha/beta hydrolase [Veronia nyctiphanis]
MSSKIYFSDKEKRRLGVSRALINISTRAYFNIAPKSAVKTARKLFLTPAKAKNKNTTPGGMVTSDVMSASGKIRVYRLGVGPTWVMAHGWSGSANQFFPLMEKVAAMGFTAVAYDQPAHGGSEGHEAHIPNMLAALKAVLGDVGDVEGLICHSMGGSVSLHIADEVLQGKPCLLIAPALFYWKNAKNTVRRVGVHMSLYDAVINEVSREYNFLPSDFDPDQRLIEMSSPVTIVHDRNDKFAPFEASEKAALCSHINLIATEGLGHGSIIKSDQVATAFRALALPVHQKEIA